MPERGAMTPENGFNTNGPTFPAALDVNFLNFTTVGCSFQGVLHGPQRALANTTKHIITATFKEHVQNRANKQSMIHRYLSDSNYMIL